jgi:hypothetical protein
MLKLAACTFDVYDDSSRAIARRIPAEYHSALKVAEHDEVLNLPDSAFGLILKTASGTVLRRYPLHDADAVKVSAMYWHETKTLLPPDARAIVQAKLAAAARYHDGDQSPEALAGMHKVAFIDATKFAHTAAPTWDDKAWGLTVGGRDLFPLHDASLVKQAAARYAATTADLNPEHKFTYARNIAKRASALGVALPADSLIHRYTNADINLVALDHAIERRKMASPNLGKDILDQLAKAAGCRLVRNEHENDATWALRNAKLASARKLSADKVVAVLQQFDKLAAYTPRDYARHIPDPFASVYAKSAAAEGVFVDGVDLAAISPEALASHFDEHFIREFTENPAQVYMASPDPVKRLIRAQAEKGGNLPPAQPAQPYEPTGHGDPMPTLNPTYANGSAASGI